LKTLITNTRPLGLALNRGVFLILAHQRDLDLMQAFVNRCHVDHLVKHTKILEWLFASSGEGRWLRRLLASTFDGLAVHNEGDVDAFDYQVFDKLVMYRYTPRLMKEPYARGIFLNLMRVPIKEQLQRRR
jgi:hypothetical protein